MERWSLSFYLSLVIRVQDPVLDGVQWKEILNKGNVFYHPNLIPLCQGSREKSRLKDTTTFRTRNIKLPCLLFRFTSYPWSKTCISFLVTQYPVLETSTKSVLCSGTRGITVAEVKEGFRRQFSITLRRRLCNVSTGHDLWHGSWPLSSHPFHPKSKTSSDRLLPLSIHVPINIIHIISETTRVYVPLSFFIHPQRRVDHPRYLSKVFLYPRLNSVSYPSPSFLCTVLVF